MAELTENGVSIVGLDGSQTESLKPNEKEDFSFVEFFSASQEQKEALRKAVEATNGTLEIWIHTHYVGDFDPQTADDIDNFSAYAHSRTRFIQQGHRGKMPIIAMIDSHPLVDTKDDIVIDYKTFYADLAPDETSSKIYFVRTFDGHAVPCVTHQEDYAVTKEDTRIDNWNRFGQELASLGVKNVIIRGRNFAMEERDVDKLDTAYTLYTENRQGATKDKVEGKVLVPSRCVGDAMVNLEVRGFNILSSKLTYPEKPAS